METKDWLKLSASTDNCHDPIFLLKTIKENFQVETLIDEWLWVAHNNNPDEDGSCWLDFAFFEFRACCVDDSEDQYEVALLLQGCGPTGALKECRHTYWGPKSDGYIFYPDAKRIKAALDWLSKHYDMD